MATTYTYSFNCTIKYRLSSEAADASTPTFDDSIVLYSCTAETTELDSIKVPLPDYLQGVESSIQWYLSKEYTDAVVSGEELKASQWTLTNKVELGTFISYDAEIILYTNSAPKTLKWVYKQENATEITITTETWQTIPDNTSENYTTEYANFISVYAPKIPTWVSSKNGNNSTLYVFTGWKDPVKTADVEEYTIEADYSETTYDEANPYTLKSANPFADAEPYHYGTGTPSGGYYMPIGEDSDNNTTDIKVQAPENNGYSKINTLNQFKINSKGISYIEAGTFPLLNEVTSIKSAGTYQLTIKYDTATTKITTITLGETNCYNAANKNGPLYAQFKHGNEEFPKRLGFILVGGGGGSGGGGRYDPDKDKKNSHGDFIIPGGGGGGGEIVYGVLDISYEAAKKLQGSEKPSELVYYVKVGSGGSCGSHNISSGASEGGHDGTAGTKGNDSVLSIKKAGKDVEILKACGGYGGGGATKFTLGTGGDGGSYSNSRNIANIASTHNCVVTGAIKGGRGGHPTSQTSVENESLSFSIYFSDTVPPANYMLSKSYSASSKTYSTDENTDAVVFQTPGGHSFGSGATSGSSAVTGGGGGCYATNNRTGTAGYFGIYY